MQEKPQKVVRYSRLTKPKNDLCTKEQNPKTIDVENSEHQTERDSIIAHPQPLAAQIARRGDYNARIQKTSRNKQTGATCSCIRTKTQSTTFIRKTN